MKIYENAAAAAGILKRGGFDDPARAETVRAIVADVRRNGDRALFSYCEKFDGAALTAETVAVSPRRV